MHQLSVPYIVGIVSTAGSVLQCELLDPPLPLLKHSRASIRWKVELLHHHVLWHADLLPQVQTVWYNMTDKWSFLNK